MEKYKKRMLLIISAVMTIFLFIGILLIIPKDKTADATTYYVSDASDAGNKPVGTTYLDVKDALNVSSDGKITGMKGVLNGPFYLKIPASINGTVITSIGTRAFSRTQIIGLEFAADSQLTSFEGKDDSIGDIALNNYYMWDNKSPSGAFASCQQLQSVSLPESLTSIGSTAFYGCTNLTSINIPANVNKIDIGAFARCSNLATVTFSGNKITEFSQGLFYNDISLKNMEIPASVESIGAGALYGCAKITRLDLSNVTHLGVGYNATNPYLEPFYGMSKLAEVKLPEEINVQDMYNKSETVKMSDYKKATDSDTAHKLGYLLHQDNAIYNVYYGTGNATVSGQSYYLNVNGFVFVKNTGWREGDVVTVNLPKYGEDDNTHRQFEQSWYLIDYRGTDNQDANVPLQFPTQKEFQDALAEKNLSVANTYDIAPRAFGDGAYRMYNVKISDAVRYIGNEAFASSGLQIIDMSEAINLRLIGDGFAKGDPSPIIYLPRTAEPVRIGMNDWCNPQMVIAPDLPTYNKIKEDKNLSTIGYGAEEGFTFLIAKDCITTVRRVIPQTRTTLMIRKRVCTNSLIIT